MRAITLTSITCFLALTLLSQPAAAAKPWHASLHVGGAEIERLVRADGPWWARMDDDSTALGVSLAYDLLPSLGLRVMYERTDDLAATNVCPPGATCPAIAISEELDFEAWQLVLMPRHRFSREWTAFATLGAQDWKLAADGVLPGDSGTAFVYGVGLGWRATARSEFTFEYQGSDIDYDTVRMGLGVRF